MKEIALSRGKVAIVDASDYEWLSQWKWSAFFRKDRNRWYAMRSTWNQTTQKMRSLLMHREIMAAQKGILVDHRDGDGLNNQRVNLRLCTNQQNQCNTALRRTNTSGYAGVYWDKRECRWKAQIAVSGKRRHLGYFDDIKEAAQAYAKASLELHGDFSAIHRGSGGEVPQVSPPDIPCAGSCNTLFGEKSPCQSTCPMYDVANSDLGQRAEVGDPGPYSSVDECGPDGIPIHEHMGHGLDRLVRQVDGVLVRKGVVEEALL